MQNGSMKVKFSEHRAQWFIK